MDYEKWLPELEICPIFDDLGSGEIMAVLSELTPEIVHFNKDDPILAIFPGPFCMELYISGFISYTILSPARKE